MNHPRQMKTIDYHEFRSVVVRHIRDLDSTGPNAQSTEWYLLKYLRRIERSTEEPVSDHDVENSLRALLRFYVDLIEPESALGRRCRDIFEARIRFRRDHQ